MKKSGAKEKWNPQDDPEKGARFQQNSTWQKESYLD